MASKPGPLSRWPWQDLGNYKYALLAPWAARSTYKFVTSRSEERDLLSFAVLPVLLLRLLYSQLWITVSRHQTARSKHRIINKSLDFDQVDRERNWDDQIILTALLFYVVNAAVPMAQGMPWWNSKGLVVSLVLHVGPVEFLYYWFHRALHHHCLYSRYHSHHHASIVTEPITSVIHPFAEELVYFTLFAIPLLSMVGTNTASVVVANGYLVYIDFMNYLGHCNFEFVPKCLFDVFPPLKYLMYTPSFHSLHHTQFRTNYSLFMPFYDYLYGTLDKSSDDLYERALHGREEAPDVVHLTHLTTPESIFHLRLGFASLASAPLASRLLRLRAAYPLAALASLLGRTFRSEANRLEKLNVETWVVPRYTSQYRSKEGVHAVSRLIEKAVADAEASGARVLTLGLLNQAYELNKNGELYIIRKPNLKTKIVDGSSLAAAAVLHMIPEGTKDVLLLGNANKISFVLTLALCEREIQVQMVDKDSYDCLKQELRPEMHKYLVLSCSYDDSKVWLVGDGLTDQEQRKARDGVHFVPHSQFPPKAIRKDCVYHSTPALVVPDSFENLHACENWLPRRVMSAWRAAGIVHALEKWDAHECGGKVTGVDRAWRAALAHGFRPYDRHAAAE
ncbi:very-long-chain aldehyde decarbonylase GL1-6-like [Phragmites australis]|uniref:very-long-chain aldehyde decarbonylase GL1-6-like n=1 Tax=Phragmites australis TaxID=29695 RepID=UPI002D798FD5|nr:very-long-chain aldehyde decarbonylase GL1-6-like [Phragmites australis]